MQTIGVIGCGLMGYGMAKNLISKGYEVTVYDVNSDAVKRVVAEGASGASSVSDIAKSSDVLILSLPSTDLVEKVLVDDGVLQNLKRGSAILDMSTNDVTRTRKLEEAATVAGVSYFDCPVSGGPDGAISGMLTIMVGGSEEVFAEISSVLQDMGKHIEYMGKSGSGQIVKLCNNMVVGGIISLLSEALLTGERAGIPKERLAELFQKGSGQTKVMDVFGPTIIEETFDEVTFSLANMMKDLSLYRNLANDEGIPTIISDAAYGLFNQASVEGADRRDSTAVAELLSREVDN